MKKLLGICLSFAILCTAFVLGASAAKGDYGYCDTDHNGKIEFTDALENLKAVVNNTDESITLVNVLHSFQAAISGQTLAATINEESVTLEDVYEPYLMQIGFLTRTPRGRCVTPKAYQHLGIAVPGGVPEQLSFS